ncbi:hypothetical protein WKK05_36420 (plasmid) [Nostoc sp. UHCC 0302]|uniref:hypothetical protein n=1 Tax=Nostoc sp. UHCC 0302 TaxID=3134896 RepID=UPI00311C9A7C
MPEPLLNVEHCLKKLSKQKATIMEITLTTSEIREILKGCQQTLRQSQTMQDTHEVESSQDFTALDAMILDKTANVLFEVIEAIDDSNEIVLNDTVNVLFQVIGAISNYESETKRQLQQVGNI